MIPDSDSEYLDFPLSIGNDGRLKITKPDDHLKDLILSILLTSPGERVNLPEFGCGLRKIIFSGNNPALSTWTNFVVSQALARWLPKEIVVDDVITRIDEEKLYVEIQYRKKDFDEIHNVKLII